MTSNPLTRFLAQRSATLGRRIRLRPMTTSEILDTSIQVYQTLGRNILRLTAGAAFLCTFAIAFIGNVLIPKLFVTSRPDSVGTQLIEAGGALSIALLVAVPLFLVGVSYSSAIVIQLVSDYMNGRIPNVDAARVGALRTWKRLLVLNFRETLLCSSGLVVSILILALSAMGSGGDDSMSLLAGLAGVLGLPLGLLVYVIVITRHALAAPIVHLESAKPAEAAKRSALLLKRDGPIPSGDSTVSNALGLLFLMCLIIPGGLTGVLEGVGLRDWISGILLGTPIREVVVTMMEYTPAYLLLWTSVPVWATMITILYFERRIRKEGYDIEALTADALGGDGKARHKL